MRVISRDFLAPQDSSLTSHRVMPTFEGQPEEYQSLRYSALLHVRGAKVVARGLFGETMVPPMS